MKILIMIDMQNDFLTGTLGNPETAAVLSNVCSKVEEYLKSGGFPLVYTMDTHGDNYSDTQEGKKLPVPHCIDGTEGWELPKKLKSIIGENAVCIKKNTFGARELPGILKKIESEAEEKISEIELIGVCTDICVISNALLIKAFYPELPVIVDSSCCAGVTPQSHLNALEAMKMCQIEII
ncbi:MAG: cysteine hydrolase family protein [Ruminococcus sp.]